LEKILTFALPTERKGKKNQNGGCRKGNKTRLKRKKHRLDEQDRLKLKPKIYKMTGREVNQVNKFLKEMSM
jgi:hypothetical protein